MFNDLKAPRFNPRKYRKNFITEELYERWKAKTKSDKPFKYFENVCHRIAEEMSLSILDEPDGIRLPRGLGEIYVGYVPRTSKKGVDYQLSMKYDKKIYHENWNSNNKLGKIIYGVSRRKYLYRLAKYWGFTGCRNFKRTVSRALDEKPEFFKNSIEKRNGKI